MHSICTIALYYKFINLTSSWYILIHNVYKMHIHITYTKECLKSEGNSLGTLEDHSCCHLGFHSSHRAIWAQVSSPQEHGSTRFGPSCSHPSMKSWLHVKIEFTKILYIYNYSINIYIYVSYKYLYAIIYTLEFYHNQVPSDHDRWKPRSPFPNPWRRDVLCFTRSWLLRKYLKWGWVKTLVPSEHQNSW